MADVCASSSTSSSPSPASNLDSSYTSDVILPSAETPPFAKDLPLALRRAHRVNAGLRKEPYILVPDKFETSISKTKDLKITLKRKLDTSHSSKVHKKKQAGEQDDYVPSSKKKKKIPKKRRDQDSSNDFYCWVCHREGSVICCELCPRVYHSRCLQLKDEPDGDWFCPECQKIMKAECVESQSTAMSMLTVEQLSRLLIFSLQRMRHAWAQPFLKPVDPEVVPEYYEYIFYPMDLATLEKNIKSRKFGSTDAFLSEAKWILHNCIVYNGSNHKLTNNAKMIIKICKHEMSEIEVCQDCYLSSCMKRDNWFCEPCRVVHSIVWARLQGFPFWPAKALQTKKGQVDVRFFGQHDRAWVPVPNCFMISKDIPFPAKKKASGLNNAISEMAIHIEKIRKKFGKFEYAEYRTPYDAQNTNHKKTVTSAQKNYQKAKMNILKTPVVLIKKEPLDKLFMDIEKQSIATAKATDDTENVPFKNNCDASLDKKASNDMSLDDKTVLRNANESGCTMETTNDKCDRPSGDVNNEEDVDKKESNVSICELKTEEHSSVSLISAGSQNKSSDEEVAMNSEDISTTLPVDVLGKSSESLDPEENHSSMLLGNKDVPSTIVITKLEEKQLKEIVRNKEDTFKLDENEKKQEEDEAQEICENGDKATEVEKSRMEGKNIVENKKKQEEDDDQEMCENGDKATEVEKSRMEGKNIVENNKKQEEDEDQEMSENGDKATEVEKSRIEGNNIVENEVIQTRESISIGQEGKNKMGASTKDGQISNEQDKVTLDESCKVIDEVRHHQTPMADENDVASPEGTPKKDTFLEKLGKTIESCKALLGLDKSELDEKVADAHSDSESEESESDSESSDDDIEDLGYEVRRKGSCSSEEAMEMNTITSEQGVNNEVVIAIDVDKDEKKSHSVDIHSNKSHNDVGEEIQNGVNAPITNELDDFDDDMIEDGVLLIDESDQETNETKLDDTDTIHTDINIATKCTHESTESMKKTDNIVAMEMDSGVKNLEENVIEIGNAGAMNDNTDSMEVDENQSDEHETSNKTDINGKVEDTRTNIVVTDTKKEECLEKDEVLDHVKEIVDLVRLQSPVMNLMNGISSTTSEDVSKDQNSMLTPLKGDAQSKEQSTSRSYGRIAAGIKNFDKYIGKVTDVVKQTLIEIYSEVAEGSVEDETKKVMKSFQEDVDFLKWRHTRELEEFKHVAALTIAEMRSTFDHDKASALEGLRKQMEVEKQTAVDATKKKQWCANCVKEAVFYCCWNTSYCDYPCQQKHWPSHMKTCQQLGTVENGDKNSKLAVTIKAASIMKPLVQHQQVSEASIHTNQQIVNTNRPHPVQIIPAITSNTNKVQTLIHYVQAPLGTSLQSAQIRSSQPRLAQPNPPGIYRIEPVQQFPVLRAQSIVRAQNVVGPPRQSIILRPNTIQQLPTINQNNYLK